MTTGKSAPPAGHPETTPIERLDSWKEIAAYLKRDERTVRRWEKEGLPVHRHLHRKRAAVYAYKPEIDAWWNNGRQHLEQEEETVATRRLRLAWLLAAPLLGVALVATGYFVRQGFWPQPKQPAGRIMLAVLPFENLSAIAEQEYFSDGLTEEMITQLGRLHPERLGVIARTSAMQYKKTNKTTDKIGRELGVQYILEGSVRRNSGRVRITAQLIRVSDQSHLWAESYERDLRDILALQNEVARDIASEIRIKLKPQEQARLASARPVNPEAHEAYLRGRYHLERWSADGARKAIEYFEQAIQKDQNNALAYAGVAETYVWASGNPLFWEGAIPKAKAAAMKALEIDETLGAARTALAMSKLYNDWDFPGAEREFRRAIELNPNYPPAHHWYSHCLMATGRFEESLAESQSFLKLDPLSPAANLHLAWNYLAARQSDEAVEQFQKTLEMDPNYVEARHGVARAYLQMGKHKEAMAQLQKAVELSGGGVLYLGTLGHAYGLAGRRAEAQKLLVELLDRSKRSYVSPYSIAVIYVALGRKDQAFAWLEKACEERSKALIELRESFEFDSLRSDLRFHELLRRIGLPQ